MITGDALKKQLSIIASAEIQGCETGTEGQRIAMMKSDKPIPTLTR